MRTALTVLMVCLLAGGAAAQKVENSEDADFPRTECATDYYAVFDGPGGGIPDGDPNGAAFGQIATPEGETIEDVILEIDIAHSWIGDLRVFLLYDTDCDGLAEFTGQVLCRHSLEGCAGDGCCGCSGDLAGVYVFDDTAPSIEDVCPTTFEPGCYGPDLESSGLDVFNGLPTGGCWMLYVADGATYDVGVLNGYKVYVLYESTPVDETTWGMVKALYK